MGNNMRLLFSRAPWQSKPARQINPLLGSLRLFLLVLLASFLGSIPVHASDSSLPASWYRSSFAIADFDNDGRQNLAIVQLTSNSSSLSIYRVQVQLGDGGLRSTDFVAPSGGIRIAALDVNRDAIPDLIVSSAWGEEPIGVLLNDGRGAFSSVDPSSFPGAFSRSKSSLNSDLPSYKETVTIPTQSPVGEFSESKYLLHPRPAAGSILEAHSAAFLSALLVSLPERAPPTPSRA
jgi:hypothetical protein